MNSQPPALLVAATAEVLRRHAPFDAMSADELAFLAARLQVRYYAKGEAIVTPDAGRIERLWIVQRGAVRGTSSHPALHVEAVQLGPGELFPVGALIARRPTTLAYAATEDTFCYVLEEGDFEALMRSSPEFNHFCTVRLAHLLEQSSREVRDAFANRAADELGMATALGEVVRRPPVTLPATASVREMLVLMHAQRLGSIVLTGAQGNAVGIFTQTDVLDRVALAGCQLERSAADVMTREPVAMDASATVAEAAQRMASQGFRHLLVTRGGQLAGVVSERDLFALQRRSVQGLAKEVARAGSREALALAAFEVRELAGVLVGQGVGPEMLVQLVTTLNDAICARAVQLAEPAHAVSDIGYCWIGLGSEGRMEQTIATDQDNAIVFADDAPAGTRERLLKFAREVNETLAACGFTLCRGEIMASNPKWCLALREWRERFDDWIRNASPEALLNAAIFFDLRPLAGDFALAEALRDFITERARRPAFLRQMAVNALEVQPPLGLFDHIALRGEPRLDLKIYASRPFVDCARILALGSGVRATSTVARLRAAGAALRMDADEVGGSVQAFLFVQMLRLRRQQEAGDDPGGAPNSVDPAALPPLDRRILKETLRQARKLQNRVALEYRLA